jgi:hypothetical protein
MLEERLGSRKIKAEELAAFFCKNLVLYRLLHMLRSCLRFDEGFNLLVVTVEWCNCYCN